MVQHQDEDKIPLTSEGLAELKEEYQELVEEKRPEALERIVKARTIGELTEDNEYSQARQQLSFIDGRISELEEVINRAVLIDEGHSKCKEVTLGCKVTVSAKNGKHVFHLVGEWEADPAVKKISHKSPLGQSLLGKKVGEKVEVEAPAGKIVYTIIKVD